MKTDNKKQHLTTKDELTEFLLYTTPNGNVKVEIFFNNETVWLTQKRMAELFGVGVNTINYHLKEIFKAGELEENSVIRKYRITAQDGKKHNTNFYNLDSILSVGYRVRRSIHNRTVKKFLTVQLVRITYRFKMTDEECP